MHDTYKFWNEYVYAKITSQIYNVLMMASLTI